jgi:2-oxoisovalerate dehydrogenase E1 component
VSTTKESRVKFSQARVKEILADYRLACESREASVLGRKEVFMGKAKFGIFGDGKEVAQLAMAKVFRNGDFRSGYYRDQTFMLAIGQLTLEQYFAQLYAHADVEADPAHAGRLMNGHFATRMLDENGEWKNLTQLKNSSADISPTAAQMPRLLGMAYASKLFRNNPGLAQFENLSINGNEIAFGTIGNASTSEGMFYEAINAAGVLQVPMLMSVWDDHYGISVPQEFHTTRGSISKVLAGFSRNENENGFEIFTVKGWDYTSLISTYQRAEKICREEHVPILIHVEEVTQPQGHSTSGSHERYKSKERLVWELEHDCIIKMRRWIVDEVLVVPEELDAIEKEAKQTAREAKDRAWKTFNSEIQKEVNVLIDLFDRAGKQSQYPEELEEVKLQLQKTINPLWMDCMKAAKKGLRLMLKESSDTRVELVDWVTRITKDSDERYSSHVYSQSNESALNVREIKPEFSENSREVDGREVLNACFVAAFTRDPKVFALGEDVGKIGDVNQGFAGLQEKFGALRVTDTVFVSVPLWDRE